MLLPPPAPTTSAAEVFLRACLFACLSQTVKSSVRHVNPGTSKKEKRGREKKNGEKAYYPDTLDMDFQGSAGSERTVD